MHDWLTCILFIIFIAWDFTFVVRAVAERVYPAVFFFFAMLLIQVGSFAVLLVQTVPLLMKGH